ncbi:MAG TPA: metallophosphoesterase [Solirubrobacteraceae bacterium]|nr:metallophosphoesterase [Solirubrobacteraceae bacterium]
MTLAEQPTGRVRIAAVGDLHCRESRRAEIATAFGAIGADVDLILLAGDLTTHGQPEQAQILADACRPIDTPVLAVLGNHDWHCDRAAEVVAVLRDAGIVMLERGHAVLAVGGIDVGVVGLKGFVGGFHGYRIPDFGEPLLRAVYDTTSADVEALDSGLRAIAACPLRIVLLHYSPVEATLEGEPREIWSFLGTDRLAAPIAEHGPHVVLHGHAHAGSFAGAIGDVPVYNVSAPVIERDFCVFELTGAGATSAAVH